MTQVYILPKKVILFDSKDEKKNNDAMEMNHTLVTQYKPLLRLLRIFCVVPLTYSANGHAHFKWRSLWTLYSVVVYGVITIIFGNIIVAKLKVNTSAIAPEDNPYHFGSLLLMLHHFLPLWCMIEIKKIAGFLNQWKLTEDQYSAISGQGLKISLKGMLFCAVAFALTMTAAMGYYFHELSTHYYSKHSISTVFSCLELPIMVYQQAVVTSAGGLWLLCNIGVQKFGSVILKEIKEIHKMNGKAIGQYAALWVQLRNLVCALGNAFSYSGLFFMFCQFCINVASFYTFATSVVQGQSFGGHSIIAGLCLILQINVPEVSHHVVEKVGQEFQSRLAEARSIVGCSSPVSEELKQFHDFTVLNPPYISLGGFVTLNRGLTVSILASYVTYVVIFLQMNPTQ